MTPEQINVAIAEACGWTNDGHHWIRPNGKQTFQCAYPELPTASMPDYCNDLNAMHEALHSLTYEQQPYYLDILTRKVMMKPDGVSSWDRHTATARQRAEAFLRTLNGWREQ